MRNTGVCLAIVAAAASCVGGGGRPAGLVEGMPGGKCLLASDRTSPLIVEWSGPSRGQLEAMRAKHVVAVRYTGCEIEMLPQCEVAHRYAYVPLTPKHDRVVVKNEEELYANLPFHAAQLSAKLASKGELDVDMSVVGRFEADATTVRRDDLSGDCAGATHVIAGLTVGAFRFFAGSEGRGDVRVAVLGAGGGGASSSQREVLNQDGNDQACGHAAAGDKEPPYGCGALERIDLVPIGVARGPVPICPGETQWDGKQCIRIDPGPVGTCPDGTTLVHGVCVPPGPPPCIAGQPGCTPSVPSVCPGGTVYTEGNCIPLDGSKCPIGWHYDNARGCLPDGTGPNPGECPPGTHREGGGCEQNGVAPGTMVRIPGAGFLMMRKHVSVATFDIDRTKVTIAAYKACVDAGACTVPFFQGQYDCNWNRDGRGDYPVNCVDWSQAATYCRWAGKRLPTDKEWEFAAIGQTGWKYPWGNEPAKESDLCMVDNQDANSCPVGRYPATQSRFGLLDMAELPREWLMDAYCRDLEGPGDCHPYSHVIRWARRGVEEGRAEGYQQDHDSGDGFRCAKTP